MGQTTPCNQCPPGKTSIEGSAKCDICPSGSYDRNHPAGSDGSGGGPEALECRSCIANAVCIAGATIATINITAGMWRASDRSDILYPCIKRGQVTPCLGGVTVGEAGDGYCTAGTSGALCQTCTNKTHFFNRKGARCEQCPEISDQVGIWLAVLGGVASVSLLVFFIHRLLPPWQRDALKSFSTRWNIILSHELAVVPKAKLILSTIQVTLALPSVYAVRMPETYQQFFAGAADAFSLDLELLPVECWWGGTVNKLFFDGLWPIALTACIYVGSCISSISKSRRSMRAAVKAGALESLPWVLVVTFSVAPVTAGRAFAAWTCDQIVVDSLATPREVRSFLRADTSIECFDSVAHQRLVAIAIAFVCIYPVGVPVAYLLMMRHLRHSIYEGRSTRLVSATGFLHAEYRRSKFFWEPVALLYRLVLVGFVQLIPPEYGFLRIIMALLVSMSYSVLLAHAVPFKRQEHNVMALLSQSLLIAYLMGVLCIKLFQDASDFGLSLGYPRLASDLIGLSSDGAISNVLVAATFVLILVFVAILVVQATRLHKGAIILLAATKRPPDLTLADAMKYHLFLSHVWSSAQDQVAVIKRQLLLMLQGNVSIFLDVDDLKDIGDLGKYVHASQAVLVFLSQGYFYSGNCLKEFDFTLEYAKPIILVHEADPKKGGAPILALQGDCQVSRPDKVDLVFTEDAQVVTWHRVAEFQRLSLKLIAERMLQASPSFAGRTFARGAMLYMPGEVALDTMHFAEPYCMYVSVHNPGAKEFANELLSKVGAGEGGERPLKLAYRSSFTVGGMSAASKNTGMWSTALDAELLRTLDGRSKQWRGAMAKVKLANLVLGSAADATKEEPYRECTHMLIYLNKHTFVGLEGFAFAEEIRRAREKDVTIVMVHENDERLDGCDFGHFFTTTPNDLIASGLYAKIALACHAGPHRSVSLVGIAREVGAITNDSTAFKSLSRRSMAVGTGATHTARQAASKVRIRFRHIDNQIEAQSTSIGHIDDAAI